MPETAARPRYRPLTLMAGFVLLVAAMYWGRSVLIPVALAVLLAFMLSPLVRLLQVRGLPRIYAVMLVVVAAFVVIGLIVWIITVQLTNLAHDFPHYETIVHEKIKGLREALKGTVVEKLFTATPPAPVEPPGQHPGAREKAFVVVVPADRPDLIWQVAAALDPVLHLLGSIGLIGLLVILMLIHREELRNRLIRLAGYGRLTVTTRALDEASQRISLYLNMKSMINGGFGIAVGLGLMLVGIPYAFLWGFLTAVLRFIPNLGTWLGMAAPLALAAIAIEGWMPIFYVLVLYIVLELATNNLVEPWMYGRHIGVSSVALVVALAFWTWLWGPVGLVLATPLTVCLAVLGKYFPQLSFIDVIMSDQPALEVSVGYYQRLLARDEDEAADIVDAFVETHSREDVYDELLLPALATARQDHEQERLSDDDLRFLLGATREVLEEIAPAEDDAPPPTDGEAARPVLVLGYPMRDEVAAVALRMLGQILDPKRCRLDLAPAGMLSSEIAGLIQEKGPAVLCVASLAPGGLALTRSVLKRLRARFPLLKIVAARLGPVDNPEKERKVLLAAGADSAAATLLETRNHVTQQAQFASQASVTA